MELKNNVMKTKICAVITADNVKDALNDMEISIGRFDGIKAGFYQGYRQ